MAGHRTLDGGGIEDVDGHRGGAQAAKHLRLLRSAGDGGDVVAGLHQVADGAPPEDSCGSGDEDPHCSTSWNQAAPLATASVWTVVASLWRRSATVVRASSARHASSARYMASAMAHTGE
jgi:hypothetical protein